MNPLSGLTQLLDKDSSNKLSRSSACCVSTNMEVTEMEKTTMTVHELAIQLGISIPKAYELIKSPNFPSIRIGSRIIIPIDEYKKWLKESSGGKANEINNNL